jgi:hypothetical protein
MFTSSYSDGYFLGVAPFSAASTGLALAFFGAGRASALAFFFLLAILSPIVPPAQDCASAAMARCHALNQCAPGPQEGLCRFRHRRRKSPCKHENAVPGAPGAASFRPKPELLLRRLVAGLGRSGLRCGFLGVSHVGHSVARGRGGMPCLSFNMAISADFQRAVPTVIERIFPFTAVVCLAASQQQPNLADACPADEIDASLRNRRARIGVRLPRTPTYLLGSGKYDPGMSRNEVPKRKREGVNPLFPARNTRSGFGEKIPRSDGCEDQSRMVRSES